MFSRPTPRCYCCAAIVPPETPLIQVAGYFSYSACSPQCESTLLRREIVRLREIWLSAEEKRIAAENKRAATWRAKMATRATAPLPEPKPREVPPKDARGRFVKRSAV